MARSPSKLEEYIETLYTSETELMKRIKNEQSQGEIAMQISALEGKIIYLLLLSISARRVVEIGMFRGYSTLWILEALGAGGVVRTYEEDVEAIALFKQRVASYNPELMERIQIVEGDAKQTLQAFEGEVDAVFIDADKSAYPFYLQQASRILRSGGLLIADNTLLYGHMYNEPWQNASLRSIKAMEEFNTELATDTSFRSVILPTREGLSVAIKV